MKAVVRRGAALIEADCADPVPGMGQVLVATHACGICGSDLHALKGLDESVKRSGNASSGTIDPSRDMIMGHEFCGEILDHGPGCTHGLKAGTRVVSVPYAYGPNGQELVGFSNRFPGGFGEKMLLTERTLLEVPNGLSSEHAALTEPMAVGAHAAGKADPATRPVALVIGCGPVGLAVIASLKARGIGPVIAADYSAARRELAARVGADVVVDPGTSSPHDLWDRFDVPATLAAATEAELAGRDTRRAVIFECVGAKGLIQGIIEQAPPHSQLVLVGTCAHPDTIVPVMALRKQLRFDFVYAYTPDEFAETLHRIAEGQIDVAPFVSKVVGRSDLAAAFDELASPGALVKILVDPRRA
ncbi:zinc-binding dehydrogenase [Novosphingobium bradum]|uniref:Zinc-binding dehydrogenase n=1 Tax=Novosphingobium bradum TaxID=1737444 RepID=A0ABV7IKR0_9SPHN